MSGRTVISQSYENAVRDESLSRVGARFLPVASWDDLLRDERGMPHGQVFALDCTFVGRTCMVDRLRCMPLVLVLVHPARLLIHACRMDHLGLIFELVLVHSARWSGERAEGNRFGGRFGCRAGVGCWTEPREHTRLMLFSGGRVGWAVSTGMRAV